MANYATTPKKLANYAITPQYNPSPNYEPKTKDWTKFGPERAINVGLQSLQRLLIPPEPGTSIIIRITI